MKAWHPGHEKQQDEAQIEDREVLSSDDFVDN